jgi:hypothetical protein
METTDIDSKQESNDGRRLRYAPREIFLFKYSRYTIIDVQRIE